MRTTTPTDLAEIEEAIISLNGGERPAYFYHWTRVAGQLGLAVRFSDTTVPCLTASEIIIPVGADLDTARRILAHEIVHYILNDMTHRIARLAEDRLCGPAAAVVPAPQGRRTRRPPGVA